MWGVTNIQLLDKKVAVTQSWTTSQHTKNEFRHWAHYKLESLPMGEPTTLILPPRAAQVEKGWNYAKKKEKAFLLVFVKCLCKFRSMCWLLVFNASRYLILFTQPLCSGRIWHKVNFLSGVSQVWIKVFPFPRLVASSRLKNLVCPTIYP